MALNPGPYTGRQLEEALHAAVDETVDLRLKLADLETPKRAPASPRKAATAGITARLSSALSGGTPMLSGVLGGTPALTAGLANRLRAALGGEGFKAGGGLSRIWGGEGKGEGKGDGGGGGGVRDVASMLERPGAKEAALKALMRHAVTLKGREAIRKDGVIPVLVKVAACKAESHHTRQLALAVMAAACGKACPENQARSKHTNTPSGHGHCTVTLVTLTFPRETPVVPAMISRFYGVCFLSTPASGGKRGCARD